MPIFLKYQPIYCDILKNHFKYIKAIIYSHGGCRYELVSANTNRYQPIFWTNFHGTEEEVVEPHYGNELNLWIAFAYVRWQLHFANLRFSLLYLEVLYEWHPIILINLFNAFSSGGVGHIRACGHWSGTNHARTIFPMHLATGECPHRRNVRRLIGYEPCKDWLNP